MITRIAPRWGRVLPVVLAMALVLVGWWELTRCSRADGYAASVARETTNVTLLETQIRFEPNRGQTDPRVKFLAHGPGYSLFLTPHEAVLSLRQASAGASPDSWVIRPKASAKSAPTSPPEPDRVAVLRINLVGANPSASMQGLDALSGRVNYLIGNRPSKWQRNIPTYTRVAYRDVYPGIDQVYHGGTRDRLEYDFVVAPGANPDDIRMRFEGGDKLRMERNGDLAIALSGAEVVQHAPVIYQERAGRRERVEGKCVLRGNGTIGFEVASYDRNRVLVIDPGLVYSTYLGGNAADTGNGIAVDSSGSAYVTGSTSSTNFPVTPGAFQNTLSGPFITKFTPDGSGLVYSTYLGQLCWY